MRISEARLREITRRMILEFEGGDYGGFDGGGYGGDWGGWGMSDPWPGDLFGTFIQPFVDVGITAMGAVEDMASRGQRAVETVLQSIPAMLIPFVAAEYDKIKNAERERHGKIMNKYGAVLKRTEDAFEGDAQGVAFMLAPAHYLAVTLAKGPGINIAKNGVDAMLRVVETASSRTNVVVAMADKVREFLKLKEASGSDDQKWAYFQKNIAGALGLEEGMGESVLREDDGSGKQLPSNAEVLSAMMRRKDVQQAIAGSDVLKQMQNDAESMLSQTLMGLTSMSKKIDGISSIQQVQKIAGKDLTPEGLEDMDDAQKKAYAETIVAQAKKGMKGVITTQMKRELEWLLEQGVDKKHPYVIAYKRALGSVT